MKGQFIPPAVVEQLIRKRLGKRAWQATMDRPGDIAHCSCESNGMGQPNSESTSRLRFRRIDSTPRHYGGRRDLAPGTLGKRTVCRSAAVLVNTIAGLITSSLTLAGILCPCGAGFVIIYRATRVFNFAQGEFMMLGAYACYASLVMFDCRSGRRCCLRWWPGRLSVSSCT